MEINEKGMMYRIGIDSMREDKVNDMSNVTINIHSMLTHAGIRSTEGVLYHPLQPDAGLNAIQEMRVTKDHYQDSLSIHEDKYTEGLKDTTIISNTMIFNSLPTESINDIAQRSQRIHLKAGSTLFNKNDEGDSMFIIAHGAVRVLMKHDGKRVQTASLKLHEHFGEMSLLTGARRSCDIIAINKVVLLEITKKTMQHIFEKNPKIVDFLTKAISERKAINKQLIKQYINKKTRTIRS